MGNKSKAFVVPESAYGVCLWQLADKEYLSDGNGFLSLEGIIGDRKIEEKMQKAAHYWLGRAIGQPFWISGARQVTEEEYEEQLDRLKAGKIPDPVEEIRLKMRGEI